jgi:hypothetical protein
VSQDPDGADARPAAAERLAGGFLVAGTTLVVVLVESFLVGLRVGGVRLPVSILIALSLHPLLTRLMLEVTRSRAAMFGPALTWALVVWLLGTHRAEGDLVITGDNWVATGLLLGGAAAFAVPLGLLLPSRPAARGSLGSNGPR